MLTGLSIEHYKGFFNKQEVTFSIPNNEKDGSGLTLIVGPNNTGKTSIIESVLLNKEKKFKESERHKGIPPNITLKTQDGIHTYTNIDHGSQVQIDNEHSIQFEVVQSRRHWDHKSGETCDVETFAWRSRDADVRNSNGLNTAAVLMGINRDNYQKNRLNLYMKELIPHFSNWTIDTNDQGDYVKYTSGGHEHHANLLGDGIISLFRICAHLISETNNRVLIIDEPELSLHPTAQKTLARLLSKASCTKQIIVCTHSPYFIRWEDFLNGARFIRLNKINDEKCEVAYLDNSKSYATFIDNNVDEWQKPQILDLVAKELLFSEKILLVEGQEDVGLIRKWLKENNKDQNFDIFGYGVGGYSNMKLFLEMAKDLKLHKVAALYDSGLDADNHYENDRQIYSDCNYLFKKLKTSDIRDKPEKSIFCKNCKKEISGKNSVMKNIQETPFEEMQEKKLSKEGIFDEKGNLKEIHRDHFEEVMGSIIDYFNRQDLKRQEAAVEEPVASV